MSELVRNSSSPPSRHRRDDPGIVLSLLLDDATVQKLSLLKMNTGDAWWNQLGEAVGLALSLPPTDVIVWHLLPNCSVLEVSVPRRAAGQLKYIVPIPNSELQKLGVVSVEQGSENYMDEALCTLKLTKGVAEDFELVCLSILGREVSDFEQAGSMEAVMKALPPFTESSIDFKYKLLRVAPYKRGVRVLLLMGPSSFSPLCSNLASGQVPYAREGVVHAAVRLKMSAELGMNESKSKTYKQPTRDPSKPVPRSDKPDQDQDTWLAWVHLKRRRGCLRGPSIYLVRGKDKGRPAWHYVHVNDTLLTEFLEKTRGGALDVADYGEVLASGWGEDPPQELVDSIDRDYG